jgi:hypothetical protein
MKLLFFGCIAAAVIAYSAIAVWALLNYRRSGRGGAE